MSGPEDEVQIVRPGTAVQELDSETGVWKRWDVLPVRRRDRQPDPAHLEVRSSSPTRKAPPPTTRSAGDLAG